MKSQIQKVYRLKEIKYKIFFNCYNKIKMKFLVIFVLLLSSFSYATDPYDNDLDGKKLICLTKSDSIQDWGIKFGPNKKVNLYSLDKFLFEMYEHKRKYITNKRNIKIMNGNEIEFLINRQSLRFANKTCKLTNQEPFILLQKRIEDLKKEKTKKNFL